MQPLQFDGRSHGSVRHQRTSTEELRALGAWSFSLLASGLSFATAKGADLSRPAEAPATPGEIIPEWWATSSRNRGRLAPGISSSRSLFSLNSLILLATPADLNPIEQHQ